MKLLTTTAQISQELLRLIKECSSCKIGVAWASIGFKAFELLVEHRSKIERMIVGTHFYQTNPQFIRDFLDHPNVRFIMRADGVFHPKVYLFLKTPGEWECVVGSPNFTHGGFDSNDEMAVLISNQDAGAEAALNDVTTRLDAYWAASSPISKAELNVYQEAWKRKQPLVRSLRGKFGNPHREEEEDDRGKNPLSVRILQMAWAEYFEGVRGEQDHEPHDHSMEGRLNVIRVTKRLFSEHEKFGQIDSIGRQKIAGLVMADGVNFLWFGSMRGSGYFKNAIRNNNENLSLALELIPAVGPVSREAYVAYINQYRQAFPSGGVLIGTATRLLAIKRPDTFVCLDSRNKARLCAAFGIKRKVGYEEYWDSIIERIINEAAWWSSPPPPSGMEREVWEARAAFLDSHYYDGKDMPSS